MFDKQLCKLIHKKEITLDDIIRKIFESAIAFVNFIVLFAFGIIAIFSICIGICDFIMWTINDPYDALIKCSSVLFVAIFIAIMVYKDEIIVASCPNLDSEIATEKNEK